MPAIVAHVGVIGGGKDYRANELAKIGYERIDFKDALLDLASDIAGYDVREDYDWFKSNVVGVRRPSNRFQEAFVFTDTRELIGRSPEVLTGRRLLTRLGTEGMRKRDKDYWVKQFAKKAHMAFNAGKCAVSADCRFLNEVAVVAKIAVTHEFVFCDYRSERYNPTLEHASEKLAQALLSLGLKDGHIITQQEFNAAAVILGEPEPFGALVGMEAA